MENSREQLFHGTEASWWVTRLRFIKPRNYTCSRLYSYFFETFSHNKMNSFVHVFSCFCWGLEVRKFQLWCHLLGFIEGDSSFLCDIESTFAMSNLLPIIICEVSSEAFSLTSWIQNFDTSAYNLMNTFEAVFISQIEDYENSISLVEVVLGDR